MHATVLIIGLDGPLAVELRKALVREGHRVVSEPLGSMANCVATVERVKPDLVFCTSDRAKYTALVHAAGHLRRQVPVVVVSRLPVVNEWLDALEAGVWDYCAPPFEQRHIRDLIATTVNYARPLAPAC